MHDYDVFSVESKAEVLEKSREFWNPGKTDFWAETGVDLVIDRRDSYFIWDMSGVRLIDVHLNGGTYNLGHRNPELVEAITTGMRSFDIGNHHFPSSARAALAEALIRTAPANLTKVVYGSGGGEAIDIALKTARHATKRRKIISIVRAYHGHTGLAVAAGDDRFSRLFLSDQPDGRGAGGRRRGRRDHGDHPGDLRLPAAGTRLPGSSQGTLRAPGHALYRR
jgi:acetylornithine/succinyldiaminopimelate/putrescine aminotransferase